MLLKTMLEGSFNAATHWSKMIFSGYRDPVQPKIPFLDVSSRLLKKVTELCNAPRPTSISEWDQKSITADQDMLFEIEIIFRSQTQARGSRI
ncbi:hypothetical protein BDR03DRAFT_953509 [Suillus americanus]|nr:hypothetical protein BDR03DRAFT_953509 [Suillus americanus]